MLKPKIKLWLSWTLATTVGELVGFSVPTLIGWLAVAFGASDLGMIGIMAIAGMGEGACFSFAQWLVLKRYIKNLEKQFILYTAIAAGIAWIIGMIPSSIGDPTTLPLTILIPGAIVLIIFFLLSIGTAQWLVLRKHVKKAGWWILANAIAWPLGVAMTFIPITLVPDNSPMFLWVAAGILGGIMMGATVGAITG
ncbi:MAG: hypothetical protein ABIA67_04735, partial [Candidatus Margulisiibacteriota bacterium]